MKINYNFNQQLLQIMNDYSDDSSKKTLKDISEEIEACKISMVVQLMDTVKKYKDEEKTTTEFEIIKALKVNDEVYPSSKEVNDLVNEMNKAYNLNITFFDQEGIMNDKMDGNPIKPGFYYEFVINALETNI